MTDEQTHPHLEGLSNMREHAMAKKLERAADRIAERSPKDNARLLRDAAACIDTLFLIKEAMSEELQKSEAALAALPGGGADGLPVEVRDDARRYRKLKPMLIAADFQYDVGEMLVSALIFQIPDNARVSADLDSTIDELTPTPNPHEADQ